MGSESAGAGRPLLLKNAVLLTPNRRIEGGGLLVQGGRIDLLFESMEELGAFELSDRAKGAELIDLGGDFLSPGFIDLHCHGGGGFDFMDGEAESFAGAAALHLSHGTTSLLPTTLASSRESLYRALEAFESAKGSEGGPELLGLHLEGPYLSPAQRGAQDPRYLRPPDPAEYLPLLERFDSIARWTVAPELPGALEMGAALKERGVLPSIGHSDATYEEVARAFEAGFDLVAHLYSGTSTVSRLHGYRRAGVVESAYLIDDLAVELIADGKHLPASLLKLACKIKRPDRICLVTDAMRAAGLPEGEYALGNAAQGQLVAVRDGVAWTADGESFAGSVATADLLVRNMVELANQSVETAVAMISSSPAGVMGIRDRKGSLAPGLDADLVAFDACFAVKAVVARGRVAKCAYARG